MARAFTTNAQHITCAGSSAAPNQGTISIWIKPSWNGNDGTAHEFYGFGASGSGFSPSFQKFSDNNIYCGIIAGSDQRLVIAASALFTSGVWANWTFTYSSSGCVLYKNGVSVGSRGATTISGLQTGFRIGELPVSNVNVNSTMAEFVVWNSVFSANEALALTRGIPPFFIRYSSLLIYVPIIGLGSGEPDWGPSRFALTVDGSPAFANHAPVSFWQPPSTILQFPSAVAIGGAALHRIKRGQAGTVMRGRLGTGGAH